MTVLARQSGAIPAAEPTCLSAPFWDGCKQHVLLFQRCTKCLRPNFTPVLRCRACFGEEMHWEQSNGQAKLYSWTVIWRPLSPAFAVPYAAAIVELEEGYQMLTNIVDCQPDRLRVDLPLQVVFHAVNDELTLPYFRPRE